MNGMKRRAAAGLRNSDRHHIALAPARRAARTTLSIAAGVSVSPGIIGIISRLHLLPARLQEFMRIAGVAVDASELASAVRVDGPSKRHPRVRAAIEHGAHGHLDELDVAQRPKGRGLADGIVEEGC